MISRVTENVWQLSFKEFGSCVYLIKLRSYILIDTSTKENEKELLEDLNSINVSPEEISSIILTHSHWDHIGNLSLFPRAKIYSKLNIKEIGRKFPVFQAIETPGHTRDSICILYNGVLFSGDTIFNNGYIGRTDLPESHEEEMENSLNKLKNIRFRILCPGHLT